MLLVMIYRIAGFCAINESFAQIDDKPGYSQAQAGHMNERQEQSMRLPNDTTRMPIFDGHNDTLLNLYLPERGGGRSFLSQSDQGHLDLPRARQAGFSGGFFAIFVPSPVRNDAPRPDPTRVLTSKDAYQIELAVPVDAGYAYEFADGMLTSAFELEQAADGAVKIVHTFDQLADCFDNDVLAVVLHFEGAEPIDAQLHNLESFYQRGLRSLGLTWSRANAYGNGVPFAFPASPDIGPGLTGAGRELVRACNRLGIIVDLSHLNERGFWDVAGLSAAPLVVSHTAAHALVPRTRNLTDSQLQAVADSNGIVGVTFAIYDLCSGGYYAEAPLQALVQHIDYIAQRIGIDHVGFGSDLDGATIPPEIADVTGYPKLIAALRAQGFDEEALLKLTHENWMRVIRDTWKD
jgi:membrane dipeptidase